MSKTKAGGCGGRDVDIHLRAECESLQLRLTSRTFVGVGMVEIIKRRAERTLVFKSSFELTTIPPHSPQ